MVAYKNKKTGTVVVPSSELGEETFKRSANWEPVKQASRSGKKTGKQQPAAGQQEDSEQEG